MTIGQGAFYNNTVITDIIMPNSVTTMDGGLPRESKHGCFQNCWSLKTITFSSALTNIGRSAFNGCTSLTSITIPDSVTIIGSNAFNRCTSLTDIYYTGTQAEWESITGIGSAGIPKGATIHYEYTPN